MNPEQETGAGDSRAAAGCPLPRRVEETKDSEPVEQDHGEDGERVFQVRGI